MGCHLTCSKNFYTKIICGGSSGNDSITWTLISTFGMDSKRSAQSAIRGGTEGRRNNEEKRAEGGVSSVYAIT